MRVLLRLNRDRKIFPLALVNYITLCGGGFKREIGEKPKISSMDELTSMVSK